MAEEASNIDGGHSLPEDVIVEILSRLPVNILLRFKCVCKCWYDLISGDAFVSKHLQNYYNNKDNDPSCLLIQYFEDDANAFFPDPNLVDLNHHCLEVLSSKTPLTPLLGPCNGVYYLHSYALWNPALKECKMLPVPLLPPRGTGFSSNVIVDEITFGFGLDPTCEIYKVVNIRELCYKSSHLYYYTEVLVYSTGDDDWINVDFPWRYGVASSSSYMFLNGAYYWVGFNEDDFDDKFVLSFDMRDNSFHRVISAPTSADGSFMTILGGLGGVKLVLQHESVGWVQTGKDFFLHLWVLSPDNNCVAWTKKVTIGPPLLNFNYPRGYWKNDKLILMTDYGALLYDPATSAQDAKHLVTPPHTYFHSIIYKESLVSIDGEKYIPGAIPLNWQERFNAIDREQRNMVVTSIYEQHQYPWHLRKIQM